MATSDLHMHLIAHDYYQDRACNTVGLARTASLIAQARKEAAHTILVDNGDFLHGNPMGEYVIESPDFAAGQIHPMIAAMNALGYDAVGLGNHEFDFGCADLAKALALADFPVLCGNAVIARAAGLQAVMPSALLVRSLTLPDGQEVPLRIGVTGFLPPQVSSWAKSVLGGFLKTEDMLTAAQRVVRRLKDQDKADLVLVLAHSGIGPVLDPPHQEMAATALAALPDVDCVIAGHTHTVFPSDALRTIPGVDADHGLIAGKPAVQPGFWGSHLGIIDMTLSYSIATGWQVRASRSIARAIFQRSDQGLHPTVDDAPRIMELATPAHLATLEYIRRPISSTEIPLHSYFAMLREQAAIRLIAEAQMSHVKTLLRGSRHAALPLLSAVAPFKAGGRGGPAHYTDIPQGDLALRHIADLYPFPNTIRALRVNGRMLADWLERSAAAFQTLQPGQLNQPLMNPDFPSYNFDTIVGLTYRFDLTKPLANLASGRPRDPRNTRVTDLACNGRPVADTDEFIVATNSYRAAGGGEIPWMRDGAATVLESPDLIRDILVRHILSGAAIPPRFSPSWDFVPIPDTAAWFDTGPSAVPHLQELADLRLDALGPVESGFVRFRIHF